MSVRSRTGAGGGAGECPCGMPVPTMPNPGALETGRVNEMERRVYRCDCARVHLIDLPRILTPAWAKDLSKALRRAR